MTDGELVETLLACQFPGLRFNLIHKSWLLFLQVECPEGVCNLTGKREPWKGRKWYLSPHMTASEVVQTALKAVLTALEHEARELFTYRGQAVFNPHLDLNAVAMLAQVHRPAPEGESHA